jgi:hypothetical protein
LVVYTATPVPFKVIDPNVVVPSLKVTVPVGTLVPPDSATVAVKLTAVPEVTVVGEAARVVVVGVVRMILATKPLRSLALPERP